MLHLELGITRCGDHGRYQERRFWPDFYFPLALPTVSHDPHPRCHGHRLSHRLAGLLRVVRRRQEPGPQQRSPWYPVEPQPRACGTGHGQPGRRVLYEHASFWGVRKKSGQQVNRWQDTFDLHLPERLDFIMHLLCIAVLLLLAGESNHPSLEKPAH